MCQEIILNGEEISIIAEAKAHFSKLIRDSRYDQMPDDSCLCCLNIPATAKANGFDCKERWPGEFILTKQESSK